MKKAAPAALVVLALAAAFALSRGGRSRESLLPLSRAVAEHAKTVDRGAAIVFPLSADEEREIGADLDHSMRSPDPAPATPEASRAALWRELGLTAAASPLVTRFRGRYEFRASSHGGINAFALPGGFAYATDGLLVKLAADPDALLFVAGHEIGHIELGHTADAYRLRAPGRDPARAVLGGVASVARIFAHLHFSPSQELESDEFAVRMMRSLGRDPAAGLRVLDALGLPAVKDVKRDPGEVAVEGIADYFRTHPGAWERRGAIERAAAKGL